jgi:RNA polymerase sigma factor (sigma-70 family)
MVNKKQKYNKGEYLQGIRHNDPVIIECIFDEYEPRIIHFIRNNNGDRKDAEDVFIHALEVIFIKCKDKEFKLTCSFYTFLYSIVRNQWLRELKKRKKRNEVTIENEEVLNIREAQVPDVEGTERELLYREKFAQLGKDCRKILDMFLNDGKRMGEIAKIMGYKSEGFARQKKHRCKTKLIKLIKSDARFKELKNG